jgi:RND family efflux transporter MFP subunit
MRALCLNLLAIVGVALGHPTAGLAGDGGHQPRIETKGRSSRTDAIEGAVISPYQNANIGVEVGGVVEKFNFNEGDHVDQNAIVAEISPRRYDAITRRTTAARDARRLELSGIRKELSIKERLHVLHGTTEMAVTDTRSREEVASAHVREADADLELAKVNSGDCRVRAPFAGYLAVRYKQPHEPVDRLEKLFALVDTVKVYAMGNLSEDGLARYHNGAAANFTTSGGKVYHGRVERMSKLIDPQSRTKRVHVVIDNAAGELEIGMTGTITLAEP